MGGSADRPRWSPWATSPSNLRTTWYGLTLSLTVLQATGLQATGLKAAGLEDGSATSLIQTRLAHQRVPQHVPPEHPCVLSTASRSVPGLPPQRCAPVCSRSPSSIRGPGPFLVFSLSTASRSAPGLPGPKAPTACTPRWAPRNHGPAPPCEPLILAQHPAPYTVPTSRPQSPPPQHGLPPTLNTVSHLHPTRSPYTLHGPRIS